MALEVELPVVGDAALAPGDVEATVVQTGAVQLLDPAPFADVDASAS